MKRSTINGFRQQTSWKKVHNLTSMFPLCSRWKSMGSLFFRTPIFKYWERISNQSILQILDWLIVIKNVVNSLNFSVSYVYFNGKIHLSVKQLIIALFFVCSRFDDRKSMLLGYLFYLPWGKQASKIKFISMILLLYSWSISFIFSIYMLIGIWNKCVFGFHYSFYC